MSKNSKVIDDLIARLKKSVEEAVTPKESKRLGDTMASRIRTRTRLGYGVTEQGSQRALAKLKDSTKERRARYADDLSGLTTPNKSNLTATGQLLDAIKSVGQRGKVILEIDGRRTRELGGSRPRLSNAEVARYVQEQGRRFFDLTKAERTFLVREVKQLILGGLRKK